MTSPNDILFDETELEPARTGEAFELHRAACELQLDRPIAIREEEILSREQIDVTAFEHQIKNLLTFCRLAPVMLLADDVGLGKTISAGLILVELVLRKKVTKALVVCPSILVAQWEQELTSKFRQPVATATGGKELREAMKIERGVIVTTYETILRNMSALDNAHVQLLILDEAHRLRRLHGPGKAPQVATAIRRALERRQFKFVLMLTATPIQNRLWDLYSLIDLLTVAKGHRHPLGVSKAFSQRYIKGSKALEIQPHRLHEFRAHVRRYIARTRRADAKLPFPVREVILCSAPPSDVEQALVKTLGSHLGGLKPLLQMSLAQALMSSPDALIAQLETMVLKAPQIEGCLKAVRAIVADGHRPAKMQRLETIVNELRQARPEDFRLVIFTQRKETQNAIGAALKGMEVSYGFIRGGSARQNNETIERFKKEPPEAHVIVSTDAGAEGVNLQDGNVLVNYDLPWNPMVMEQRIGRVQRLGSKHKSVTIVNLVIADSVEERIVERLMKKLQLIGDAVGDIDAILESAGRGSKDGEAEGFQETIRKLVVESLQGKDVSEALRREERSIDEGKRLFDQNQEVIERQLGGKLDDLHTSGPAAPNLPPREPTMPLDVFVSGALRAEGATVTRLSPALLHVAPGKGRPFHALIDAETADPIPDGAVRFTPGEPAFENLVQRWAGRHAALVHDHRGATDESLNAIAARWCDEIHGAQLREVRRLASRPAFQGIADCVARAGVAHDGYETSIAVSLRDEGHAEITVDRPDAAITTDRAHVQHLFEGARQAIERAVERDEGIRELCRFYEQRRQGELAHVERGSDAERLVRASFTPTIQARIVGLQGHRYEVIKVGLVVEMDGAATYEETIELIPATSQVIAEPIRETCEQSGRRVPASWLDVCGVSQKRVLRHLLVKSEASDLRALPGELITCALSGLRVAPKETRRCAVTGEHALRERMIKSEAEGSTRYMLPGNESRSVLSSKAMAPDEVFVCPWLGDRLLPQERAACRLTGLHVSPRALNGVGEIAALRQVLDAPSQAEDAPDVLSWLERSNFFFLRKPMWARAIWSPNKKLRAVVARAELWILATTIGLVVGTAPNGALNVVGGVRL